VTPKTRSGKSIPSSRTKDRPQPAHPFLKWAGGKTQLLDRLMERVPFDFGAYYEPCVGSGALFFELATQGRLKRAYLSDSNKALMDAFLAVRDEVEDVIVALKRHRHEEKYYYRLRAADPEKLPLHQRAARMIYLNKTCYNGLYRENKQGQFNVPFGRYKNPTICDEDNLRAVSAVLQGVRVERRHFLTAVRRAQPGDFVYFDPPYHPRSRTSSFTAFDRHGFNIGDQCILRNVFAELAQRGVYVMLTNSNTRLIRELYVGFNIDRVFTSRSISSKGSGRGKISDLIIRSYD
jgi:DNA adenine methylase